jgi:polyhydroxyalkanoate synthesis regulator phasin
VVPEGPRQPADGGVTDALRAAVERTLAATAGSATTARERAGELLDEVARRGRGAREELGRRGQEARGELGRQLESIERRLAAIEDAIRAPAKPKAKD